MKGEVVTQTTGNLFVHSLLHRRSNPQPHKFSQTHDAVLEVYGGGLLFAGGTLWADTIIVTNRDAQFMYIGGTLIYRNFILTSNLTRIAMDSQRLGTGSWPGPPENDHVKPIMTGDGMSNLQEYLAGTDPNNAASRFAITSLALTNGHVRVNWSAVGGHSYVVQTNSTMGGTFADASPVIAVPGTSERVTNYLDPVVVTSGQTCFYRVRLGP